jgi:hypothetical protein
VLGPYFDLAEHENVPDDPASFPSLEGGCDCVQASLAMRVAISASFFSMAASRTARPGWWPPPGLGLPRRLVER